MFAENNDYEILTPTGWQDFRGLTRVEGKQTFRITIQDGNFVEATAGHNFSVNGKKVTVSNLKVNDFIDTVTGPQMITSIEPLGNATVYDVIEVNDTKHQFIVNVSFLSFNCDEFSFLRPSIALEFWTSIMPTLSTGGRAIITSTPNSDEDQFAQLWYGAINAEDEFGNKMDIGKNGFKAYLAIWSQHPDRDVKWEAEQRAALGDEKFDREMACKFVSADETLISATTLSGLSSLEPIAKTNNVRWFKPIVPSCFYTISLDPAIGTGGDNAAIQIVNATTLEQVGEWKHNKTDIPTQIKLLAQTARYISERTDEPDNIYYSIENNACGEAALVSLNEYGLENITGIFMSERGKRRKGFATTNRTKVLACAKLKTLIEGNKLKIHSASLISEFKNFVRSGASYAAKSGCTDDLVMAMVLNVRMLKQLSNFDADLEAQFSDHSDEFMEPLPFSFSFGR